MPAVDPAAPTLDEACAPVADWGSRPPALTQRTGFLLTELGKAAMVRADEALAPLGITAKQLHVLGLATAETRSQQQLVRLTGVDRTTMVGLVDELERLGLAERRRDPDDRRRYVVMPTAAGVATLARAEQAIEAAEAKFLAILDPAERALLHDLVARVLRAVTQRSTG